MVIYLPDTQRVNVSSRTDLELWTKLLTTDLSCAKTHKMN